MDIRLFLSYIEYKLRLIRSAIRSKVIRHIWRDERLAAFSPSWEMQDSAVGLIDLLSIKVDTNSLMVHLIY
jgi:hypothetical protein